MTPEATVVETTADFVALPLVDGEYGVAPLHSPMIGRLGYGELRIRSGGHVDCYYADGGFVQVNNNLVSVLTNRAVPGRRAGTRRSPPNNSAPPTPAGPPARRSSPSASG